MKEHPQHSPDDYELDDMEAPQSDQDYNIEDEEDNDEVYSLEDDSPENEEEVDDWKQKKGKKKRPPHPSPWKLLFEMMINPVEGWKKIRRASTTVDDVANEMFYPLMVLAAISCYGECIWRAGIGFQQATINGVKTIVSFFFGYFLVMLMIRLCFPKIHGEEVIESDFGKKFVMFNISTLALFYILYDCFPMIGPVLVFLPIWTIYLVLRGSRFFMLPASKAPLFRTLLCVFIVG
ncbi:MAG: hypothetical protein K2F87_02420, partial [Muribaculaceae bacterium]|nr:hypothetical protein [Muribaculaceae bacterium]